MPIQNKHSSHIPSAVLGNSLAYKLTKAKLLQKPNYSRRNQLTNSSTQKLINLETHQLRNSSTQKLKLLFFILQLRSNFYAILAKKQVKKQVNCLCFESFTSFVLSIFKPKTCILHHLAFLVWLLTRIFSSPNTCFQPLKTYFLMVILPFLAMRFMVL